MAVSHKLAKQNYDKIRKDNEAALIAFVKVDQECSNFRNRREDVFRLLKGNYRHTRIRQEFNNYFNEEEELQKLLDKVDKRFKETEFTKDVKGQTDENRYHLEQHRDTILKLMKP